MLGGRSHGYPNTGGHTRTAGLLCVLSLHALTKSKAYNTQPNKCKVHNLGAKDTLGSHGFK